MKLRDVVAAAVKRYRLAAGLSQQQLAARVEGFDHTKISKVETGRHVPTIDTIERLADALEVAPPLLLTPTEDA